MPQDRLNILTELKVNRLPSLPHVLVDMLQACQEHKVSFQELAAIISRDAAIAARVVSLANSSFFSRGTKVSSLERALLVLGTDTIKTLVITASIQQFFSSFSSQHSSFLKTFWRRSLSCAMLSKSFAILTSYPNPEEAYLAGLLHNIGELVLETNYTKQFTTLCQDYNEENERSQHEKQTFTINHAEVGAWLVKEWGLSNFTADAIEFHHAAPATILDAHHLVKLVYLGSNLSDHNTNTDLAHFEIAEQLFELNASLVKEIVNKIDAEVADIAQSLGIRIGEDEPESAQSDQDKHIALARQVRNLGLLQTATQELNRSNTRVELGQACQYTLELLFGYSHSAVFWYQAEHNELVHLEPSQTESVPIKFKLEAKRSLVALCAEQRRIVCSTEESQHPDQLTIVDQQILHLVHSSGFIGIPIFSNNGVYCVLVVGCDTGLKEHPAQRQLLQYFASEISTSCETTFKLLNQKERQLSVDELNVKISELVHEANNPLNIISNYLATLSHKLDDSHDVNEELRILREEVDRTGNILLRLGDLQHSELDEEHGVDINEEITNLATLYKSSLFLTHEITCELQLDPAVKRSPCKRSSFRQILTNLLKNAVEAMPDGGVIKLSTAASINVNGKRFMEVIVQDSGSGIPATVLNNLFKPVTTTKGGGHSGLGLSITKNLIRDIQGTISCKSSAEGTRFQILLPAYEADTENK